jgi:uncharacterized membrane protein YGL010W
MDRISMVEHLALYSVFHRDLRTRIIHACCAGPIMLSGAVIMAYLSERLLAPWLVLASSHWSGLLNLTTLTGIAACVAYAPRSLLVTVANAAWLLPAVIVGRALGVSSWVYAAVALGVQVLSWSVLVEIAHKRFEPLVRYAGQDVDSGLYFRKGFFLAANTGRRVSWLDAFIQFNIGNPSVSCDVLFLFFSRFACVRTLEREVRSRIALVQARLAQGQPPLIGVER